MKSAFTLIEILIVIAIVIILSALSTSVFLSAKRSAKLTKSVAGMKQIHLATMLYQQDVEGNTITYGDPAAMGLPIPAKGAPRPLYGPQGINVPVELTRNSCNFHGDLDQFQFLRYFFMIDNYDYAPGVLKLQDKTPVVIDTTCDRRPAYPSAQAQTKLVYAVTLGGSLRRVARAGNPILLDFWE